MLNEQFTISPQEAASVVVAAAGIYVVFLVLMRALGTRTLATPSVVDIAAVIALGAVVGRTALLDRPRLVTGALALVTFLAMQWLLRRLRTVARIDRWVHGRPVALVTHGVVNQQEMRRARMSENDLRHAARVAGVPTLAEVAHVVLEPNGAISVIREQADGWMLADVGSSHRSSTGT